jgi:hypothetical protein
MITKEPPKESKAELKLYDGTRLTPVGCATLICTAKTGITKKIHFEIVENIVPVSLLSGKATRALHLIKFDEACIFNVSTDESKADIMSEYKDVFTGLGTLPGEYHIQMDATVPPVQNCPRRVPLPLRAEVKKKIDDLEAQHMLAKVIQPTPWISNMVVVKKPNKIRICLDPIHLNKASVFSTEIFQL